MHPKKILSSRIFELGRIAKRLSRDKKNIFLVLDRPEAAQFSAISRKRYIDLLEVACNFIA
jgi:hypothetical protein